MNPSNNNYLVLLRDVWQMTGICYCRNVCWT